MSLEPTEQAIVAARHIYLNGGCRCDESGPCCVHIEIALEIDNARMLAVTAERAAAAAWLRTDGPGSPGDKYNQAIGGTKWEHAASCIERGEHLTKESK